ncbi:MAG: RlmE family RNA methyltransferase [Phycisphaerales bacterium]
MTRERDLRDHWFREAKRQGYRSRAAFKLTEIDDKRELFFEGARVLDCGCAPGSWLEVALERVGDRGRVVGVDLKTIRPIDDARLTMLVGDLTAMSADELTEPNRGKRYDAVISDMAPNTTGDRAMDHHGSIRLCHAVVDRCRDVLKLDGACVLKAFEGEAYRDLLERLKACFGSVKGYKPKASRTMSTEMYLIAFGYRGPKHDPWTADPDEPAPAPPPPKPVRGWGR